MNIRQAILLAADHIERNPHLYNFCEWEVPKPGCKACMLGWIGKFLGLPEGTCNNDVKRAIAWDRPWDDFYAEVVDASGGYAFQDHAVGAAAALRAYANAHHPAPTTDVGSWPEIAQLCGYSPKAVA